MLISIFIPSPKVVILGRNYNDKDGISIQIRIGHDHTCCLLSTSRNLEVNAMSWSDKYANASSFILSRSLIDWFSCSSSSTLLCGRHTFLHTHLISIGIRFVFSFHNQLFCYFILNRLSTFPITLRILWRVALISLYFCFIDWISLSFSDNSISTDFILEMSVCNFFTSTFTHTSSDIVKIDTAKGNEMRMKF